MYFSRFSWDKVLSIKDVLLWNLQWMVLMFRDVRFMIWDSLVGILDYLRILTLIVLCKLNCRYVLENKAISVSTFCELQRNDVCT